MTEMLSLDVIRMDGGTQPRATLKEELVEEYRAEMAAGAEFPPVIVFYDGENHWLADGFHRVQARKRTGHGDIAAEVRQGTKRDAILHSVGANAAHGMRRTNDDKRRSVLTLLNDSEWSGWSDREIAKKCAVDGKTVAALRPKPDTAEVPQYRTFTHPKTGRPSEMDTAKIGGSREARKPGGLVAPILGKPRPFKEPKPAPVVVQDPDLELIEPALFHLRHIASTAEKISPEVWHRKLPAKDRHNLDINLRPAADFLNALVKVHEKRALAAEGEQ
jgi:hypothetical protein